MDELKISKSSLVLAALVSAGAQANPINFDIDKPGSLPAGWTAGVTGRGSPKWAVEADGTAPSPPNVLKQSGSGTFPWCVVKGASVADGFVEVRFKSISGREDQAGGVVWRWKDGDNYYVARANALEDNVSLYYTQKGSRITLKYVNAPVPANVCTTSGSSSRASGSRSCSTASSPSSSRTATSRGRVRSAYGLKRTA